MTVLLYILGLAAILGWFCAYVAAYNLFLCELEMNELSKERDWLAWRVLILRKCVRKLERRIS